ncbi:MAG: dihydropteroate synthase [Athalassotoga sp.]|uniref:dihydropteroate synthase n=1 Tax=Athalassotoga sp. TaxID=2022597 RepID=UPI003CFC1D88
MKIGSKEFDFSRIYIMGILNLTEDSFYPPSRVKIEDVERKALGMINEGADIIDVGAESTRPGSDPVDEQEEVRRIDLAVRAIRRISDIPVSVDTYRSQTAIAGLKAGANMINDISGLKFDDRMAEVCADFNVPVVLMHIKGTPKNMQENPFYEDVLKEVYEEFERMIEKALNAGIKESKIIIDPGIGFGKRLEDNLKLIGHLDTFKKLGKPILIGISRKSMISKIMPMDVSERLEPTIALNTIAAMKGANIIRVHDVFSHVKAMKMVDAIMGV